MDKTRILECIIGQDKTQTNDNSHKKLSWVEIVHKALRYSSQGTYLSKPPLLRFKINK